jgi:hypothetical protein
LREASCSGGQVFLRLPFLKKFSQAFLTAKIIVSTVYSFPNGSSLRDIGLAIRVLNKFLWLRFPAPFFPPHGHVFNKVVKNRVKEEKEEDE